MTKLDVYVGWPNKDDAILSVYRAKNRAAAHAGQKAKTKAKNRKKGKKGNG